MNDLEYDYVIIGSGFGGSVSALRLSEKGYKVLVIEKGKWFEAKDFPKTNWNLKKWFWKPNFGLHGIFKMTFLNHVTVLSGVGVGGGSLTYANTLPIPKEDFFKTGSWANLNSWQETLKPFYKTAHKMLGAEVNPKLFDADLLLKDIAKDLGKEKEFEPTKVAVFFGEPGKKVKDPYFNGKGPDRKGCIHCGACMTGCRYNSKNTLDKNYLYLAQQLGAKIIAEKEVFNVETIDDNNSSKGYKISYKSSIGRKNKASVTAKGVIFSGGVMGTIPLLLKLKETSLKKLSNFVGKDIRTNNESLLSVTSTKDDDKDYSKGIAIGSILHTDKNSHLEPVRYAKGSSFVKLITLPTVKGKYGIFRIIGVLGVIITKPFYVLKTLFTKKYAEKTTILLFMQTLDSTLQIKKGRFTEMKTIAKEGEKPNAFIPEAITLSKKVGKKIKGIPFSNFTDVLLGTTTTAHILGGSVMGADSKTGVIDKECNVFGYKNMMICDGSMISANPGVNPSLSITAISEYAMSKIPSKKE
ncbi:GMC oxidoreductase [Polaribacter sp. Hel1_85]|uniref:GMC oxidoreductase n=1 Tax=Polaribacter sp. Hel1_85 TaxID=1250005 RepID=UPI00052CA002|nr:GMC oxidoreductase [Polaribacter sp. Hel1_85]KGL63931.1 putative cholesterol oxidase [Polaribacter sp. Hel1_85]